jgi:hypothetical protein
MAALGKKAAARKKAGKTRAENIAKVHQKAAAIKRLERTAPRAQM